MIRVDSAVLKHHEDFRGMLLSRASYAFQTAVQRIDAVRWDEPAAAAAEIRSALVEVSAGVLQASEVAGFFDAIATMRANSIEPANGSASP